MSRAVRLTATFVPLLSRPLQVSLQSLRWLARRPPASPQCRYVHLYKTARARTVLGQHKIIPFLPYSPPELDECDHRINIVQDIKDERKMIAEGITLKEAFDNYVAPGKMLQLATTPVKGFAPASVERLEELQVAEIYKDYSILEAYSTSGRASVNKKAHSGKARGNVQEIMHLQSLREVHLLLHTPLSHWSIMMDKAYQFIELSCPVEFSIRVRNVTTTKFEKTKSDSRHLFDYAFKHFPHMRPDFILKSMPKGTTFVIQPFSDGRHVQFVLGYKTKNDAMSNINLTKRLLHVRKAAQTAIKEGKASQLPKALRFQLIEQGDENYSLDDGLARGSLPDKDRNYIQTGSGANKGDLVRWGATSVNSVKEAKLEKWQAWIAGQDNARYMVPDTKDENRPVNKEMKDYIFQETTRKGAAQRAREKRRQNQIDGGGPGDPELVEANAQRQRLMAAKTEEFRKRQGWKPVGDNKRDKALRKTKTEEDITKTK